MTDFKAVEEDLFRSVPPGECLFIGLGNRDRSDDGLGIAMAGRLKAGFPARVFSEEERPAENIVLDCLDDGNIVSVLFMDAMDFGGEEGEARLFGMEDCDRFIPPFSTHKVPISLIMSIVKQHQKVPLLLGVQPLSLTFMGPMSEVVSSTLHVLEPVLSGLMRSH